MTPAPKAHPRADKPAQDKPAGKVRLTKVQLRVLTRIAQSGQTLRYESGDARNCGRASFVGDIHPSVASSTLWALISMKLVTSMAPKRKTPWYATDYRITSKGFRIAKESSK